MKTKQLNKFLIISLSLILLLVSMVCLSGCDKDKFKPKQLTTQQAQEAVETALQNAKSASSIYYSLNNDATLYNSTLYVDVNDYYESASSNEDGETTKRWIKYENGEWVTYYYYSYEDSRPAYGEKQIEQEEITTTSNIELFVAWEMEMYADLLEYDFTATQTAENTIVIKVEEESYGESIQYELTITNDYITSYTEIYEGEDESGTITCNYSYNVAQITVPEIPNIDWN